MHTFYQLMMMEDFQDGIERGLSKIVPLSTANQSADSWKL